MGFTLPDAELNPVEGAKATFDTIMDKHQMNDAVVQKIGDIRDLDFEFHEGKLEEIQLKETLGVCCIPRG